MDFDYFDKLTAVGAEKFLQDFLDVGERMYPFIASCANSSGLEANLSLESIAPILTCLLRATRTVPKKEESTLPAWIRTTEIYQKSLVEFDDFSKPFVLGAAYYLGQAMVMYSSKLNWAIGHMETAEKNMPVVHGFRYSEMAPILVIENLFLRVHRQPESLPDIDLAIRTWTQRIPKE